MVCYMLAAGYTEMPVVVGWVLTYVICHNDVCMCFFSESEEYTGAIGAEEVQQVLK